MLEKCYLLQFLVLTFVFASNGSRLLFVKTLKNTSDCPSSSDSCLTLTEYLELGNDSFSSFIFLDGYHMLDTDFTMTDLVNVSLRADSNASVSIDCGGQSRFLFNNVSGLVIENIAFISCGISSMTEPLPGISLHNLDQAELVNITITNSSSGALYIQGSNVTIMNILIHKNRVYKKGYFNGVMVENSTLFFHGNNKILHNELPLFNGNAFTCQFYINFFYETDTTEAVFLVINTELIADGTLTVTNNTSPSGIMIFQNSSFEMNGEITFMANNMCVSGALFLYGTKAILSGEVFFSDNRGNYQLRNAVAGMAVVKSILEITGKVTFSSNSAYVSSILANASQISIIGSRINNSTLYSGLINNDDVVLVSNTGLLSSILTFNSTVTIIGTNNFTKNNLVIYSVNSTLLMEGKTTFTQNGGGVLIAQSELNIHGDYTFDNNRYSYGGAIYISNSTLSIEGNGTFKNNCAVVGDGGAIYATRSLMTFRGYGRFTNNTARNGGAIYGALTEFRLQSPSLFAYESNSAIKGGALYVVDIETFDDCTTGIVSRSDSPTCFLNFDPNTDISFRFVNNTATEGGGIMYGGRLDICLLASQPALIILDRLSEVGEGNSLPTVSSDPQRFCFCENDVSNCDLPFISKRVRRGENFSVSLTTFSQTGMSIQGTARSYLESLSPDSKQSLDGELQYLKNNCTDLFYRVYSESDNELLQIYADGFCRDIGNRVRSVRVSFEDCPVGFALDIDKCVCDEMIDEFVDPCNVDNGKVTKVKDVWIGTSTNETNHFSGLILDRFCPVDYCIPPPVEIDLTNSSTQCINNRSGTLCGACKGNFSLVLGSTKCLDCSDNSFLALLLVFAVLGVLFVALLFLLQLTVSSGTIHGLILYANIINANQSAFIPPGMFTVFFAWINLDFGIETCLHDKMDRLAEAAWQFAFPVYLWLLVGMIIVICHYSIRVSKIFANSNPVSVLATIILLSYTKLLQNIIEIFSPGRLIYPNNRIVYVWWYDGSVELLTNNTPALYYVLAVIALLVLVVLFLPYTFVLLSAQFLQKSTRLSSCFNHLGLTHFIKAYHAPYKANSRYWVGLCLLVRCVILIVGESYEEVSVNLLITSSLVSGLLTVIGITGGIYCNHWLNVLELSFLLNLVLFSVVTYHIQLNGGNQIVAAYIFIAIAYIMLIAIIVIQAIQRLRKYSWFVRITNTIISKLKNARNRNSNEKGIEVKLRTVSKQEVDMVTSYDSYRLRESLLDVS